jgi:hypothetical protein
MSEQNLPVGCERGRRRKGERRRRRRDEKEVIKTIKNCFLLSEL